MKSLRTRRSGEGANLRQWETLTADRRWYFEHGDRVPDIAKIRIAFDSTNSGLVLCNLSGQIVVFNKCFLDLLQLQQHEAIYDKNIVEICGPIIDVSFVDECVADGSSRTQVKALTKRSVDEPIRILISAKRIDGSEGVPRWLMITFTQLSEQSARTMAVQQLQMDFAVAEELSGIAHWYATVEKNHDILDFPLVWSLGATTMFGIDHTELPATIRDWLANILADDRSDMLRQLQMTFSHGNAEKTNYRMNVNGIHKVFSSQCFRVNDPFDSSRYLLLGTERNITTEYSLKNELQSAVSGIKMLFDSSEWLACIVDQRLNLVYMNDSLSSALGEIDIKRNERLAVLNLFDSIQKRRAVLHNYRRAMEGSRLAQEILIMDRRGTRRRYDFSFTPIKIRRGTVIAVLIHGQSVGSINHGH